MKYRSYNPEKSDRRLRKSSRRSTFEFNKSLHSKRSKDEAKKTAVQVIKELPSQ